MQENRTLGSSMPYQQEHSNYGYGVNGDNGKGAPISQCAVFVKVKVDRSPMFAVLDSGAECSIIRSRLLPAGTVLQPSKKQLFAANDTPMKVLGSVKLMIELGEHRKRSHSWLWTLSVSCFLGEDWLEYVRGVWDHRQKTLIVRGKRYKMQNQKQ